MLGRIIALYRTLGLSVQNGTINMGEIKAYCTAMEILKDMIEIKYDNMHISKPVEYTHAQLDRIMADAMDSMTCNNRYVVISGANIDRIGEFCECWINPFFNIQLGGNGQCWSNLDNSWRELDGRELRWSMIETQ